MNKCWVCKKPLPSFFTLPSDDSWYPFNVAPHAASGGAMVGVHHKCRPVLFVAEDNDGQRTAPVSE